MPPKNSGGSSKFPGGHKVIHRPAAQTAFVRVVTLVNMEEELVSEIGDDSRLLVPIML